MLLTSTSPTVDVSKGKTKHTLTFNRIASRRDSPTDGFVYVHDFGTGFQELVFSTHEQAADYLKGLNEPKSDTNE